MKTKNALKTLDALAQEARLAVFRLLVKEGEQGLPAGEISERLAIPPATLSFHLSQLTNSKLLAFRKEGRSVIYSANPKRLNNLIRYLTEKCSDDEIPDDLEVPPPTA